MTRLITTELLRAHGACADQRGEFRRRWPRGVVPTADVCESVATVFDWDWAAEHLLPAAAREEYQRAVVPAQEEYQRAKAVALEEYDRATAPAREEYDRATATAGEEYQRAKAAALEEYQRAKAAAREEYQRAKAAALAVAWCSAE